LWSAQTGHEIARLGKHNRQVQAVAFASNGRFVASGSDDGWVHVYDPLRRAIVKPIWHEHDNVNALAFRPDGRQLTTGTENGYVRVWNWQTGKDSVFRAHTKGVKCLAYTFDGRVLATGGGDGVVKLWDARQRVEIAALKGHEKQVNGLAFSRDGKILVTAGHDGLRTWRPGE
jgi:WD40 repeat protein